MRELTFDTGVQKYTVNGVEDVFRINPTDTEFIGRLSDAFETLNGLWKNRGDTVEEDMKSDDLKQIVSGMRKMDGKTRQTIDSLLGEGVSEQVFGSVSTYALVDGFPVWANFLLSLMEDCDKAYQRERKLSNPRLEKYLKKYRKTL